MRGVLVREGAPMIRLADWTRMRATQGFEVGLVAKLAGHANPTVTLSHYTQAVRGGEEAMGR